MSDLSRFNHIESVYWVFTQLCNDSCAHCYNNSGPQGERMSTDECMRIIDHLPEKIDRLILSGGEPLAERTLLFEVLSRIQQRYGKQTQIMLQTNGDLLTGEILDRLIEHGVSRFDIASIDRYHRHKGERLDELAELFASRGVSDEEQDALVDRQRYLHETPLSWGYWGANEDFWLGGNWARGRAYENDIWMMDGSHNFCAKLSGAVGFLTGTDEVMQEISIQLWKLNPCCPGTKDPLGDVREEPVPEILARYAKNPVFQKLNEGDPYRMGERFGISEAHARERAHELQNVCRWCDEFFEKHYDIRKQRACARSETDTAA